MKHYYGIIDKDGFLSATGTNRKEIRKKRLESEDNTFSEISEGVYQYAREIREGAPLHISELKMEYNSEINDGMLHLDFPSITIGALKKWWDKLPDETEIAIWDPDTRALKSCVGFCMNGNALQLEAETWGRSFLTN